MKQPWLKWFPGDWFGDKGLRLCSLAARGLWHELCLIAHDCEPYGHVRPGGEPPSAQEIATLVGAEADEVGRLIDELKRRRVFSRTADGTIYSRRMVRDREWSLKCSEWGAKGGTPKPTPRPTPQPTPRPSRARVQNQNQNQSQKSESEPEDRSREENPPTPLRGKRAKRAALSLDQVREAITRQPALDTDGFRIAFSVWLAYREEKDYEPYLPIGLRACLSSLAKLGPWRAIAAIEHTMGNGWKGIREEEPGRGSGTQTKLDRSFAAIDRVCDEAGRTLEPGRLLP